MRIQIKGKKIEIYIKKINEIKTEKILQLYLIIKTFKEMEIKKGNNYDKIFIELEYIENVKIKEYINISKTMWVGFLHEYVAYFNDFREKTEKSGTESKIGINNYINSSFTKQKIVILMIFSIKTQKKDIIQKAQIWIDFEKKNKNYKNIVKTLKALT